MDNFWGYNFPFWMSALTFELFPINVYDETTHEKYYLAIVTLCTKIVWLLGWFFVFFLQ